MKIQMKICLILAFFVLTYFGLGSVSEKFHFSIFINTTESLPQTFFIKKYDSKQISKGSFVMFTHPWITPKVVKRVEGEPGDMVSVCNNRVFVNDKDCGFCLESTPRSSKKFSSIESGIIPEGFFFVLGDHEESFDSRYKEMGLISIESIEEVLCPLF